MSRDKLIYRLAGPDDEAVLRSLLRDNAMSGWVDLCLMREPDYFAASALFGESCAVLAEVEERADGVPVGMYACSRFLLFINGQVQPVVYLHGLRVSRHYRHRLQVLRGGFQSIAQLVPDFKNAVCCFTSIAHDNVIARRLLGANLPGMPAYRACGEMVTLVMPSSRGRDHGLLRRATVVDVPALVNFYNRCASRYQFAPCLSEKWLLGLSTAQGLALDDFWLYEIDGSLRACFALWDQRHCKQAVVRAYRAPLGWVRPLYNVWARVCGRVSLPAPGQSLQQIFLAFVAFDDMSLELMMRCLDEALFQAKVRQAKNLVLGLSAGHVLLDQVISRFRPEVYRTQIETVSWDGENRGSLDERFVQPEIAIL